MWYKKWIETNTLLLLHCWCFFGSFENYPLSLLPSFFFPADFCVGNQSAISSGQVDQHSPANHAPWTVVCTAKFTFSLYSYPIELTIVVTYVLTMHMHLHKEFLIFSLLKHSSADPTWQTVGTPKSSSLAKVWQEFHLHMTGVCGMGGWRRKINHHNNLESLIVLWCKSLIQNAACPVLWSWDKHLGEDGQEKILKVEIKWVKRTDWMGHQPIINFGQETKSLVKRKGKARKLCFLKMVQCMNKEMYYSLCSADSTNTLSWLAISHYC